MSNTENTQRCKGQGAAVNLQEEAVPRGEGDALLDAAEEGRVCGRAERGSDGGVGRVVDLEKWLLALGLAVNDEGELHRGMIAEKDVACPEIVGGLDAFLKVRRRPAPFPLPAAGGGRGRGVDGNEAEPGPLAGVDRGAAVVGHPLDADRQVNDEFLRAEGEGGLTVARPRGEEESRVAQLAALHLDGVAVPAAGQVERAEGVLK